MYENYVEADIYMECTIENREREREELAEYV